MTSKSPRPAGPSALAPIRLETTLASRIVTSAISISLALRTIIVNGFSGLRENTDAESLWPSQFSKGWKRRIGHYFQQLTPVRVAESTRPAGILTRQWISRLRILARARF